MENKTSVYIGGVADNLPPPSGVEEKEVKEIIDCLKLQIDRQEAEGKSLVSSEVESFLMRQFAQWMADAHWCPSPWQDAEAGDGTFFVVIHRSRASSSVRRLHVKMTRRNRSHKMMMATTMMMMMVTMMMMLMILI